MTQTNGTTTGNGVAGSESLSLPLFCFAWCIALTRYLCAPQAELHASVPVAMSISAFTGISWYNVLELNVIIWFTFKQRHGLYFYSLLAASWGIVFHQLGYILRFFGVSKNDYASEAIVNVGWYCMVTGQSFVLYSRLHLVVRDNRKVRWILYMIIIDFFIFHIPTSTLDFFCVYNVKKYYPYFNIMEKIQVTGFFLQEATISGLYIFETRKLLRPAKSFQKEKVRRVMRHLIYINILIILLDIVVLVTEYAGLFQIQVTFKGAVYSVKLRLEFAILNELMVLAGSSHTAGGAKSTYWLSGTGSHGSRNAKSSGGGGGGSEMALETFDTIGKPEGGANGNTLGYSYAAEAKRAPHSLSADRDRKHVVRTTEVAVSSSDPSIMEHEVYDGRKAGRKHGAAHHNRSPASSEVEFAGKGF
ncbi:hypothetical protein GP486_005603 [Trichoglossum hirsutum]|uniref:DUF7703 domain-containing protein n=1 Tax=Trichoglossum hirsutum TaxID=265104 RepID=A0A9P8L8U4_9PEZI|nr:hypothetical protein GP486_005603 [Trichoglossum hirsutum]